MTNRRVLTRAEEQEIAYRYIYEGVGIYELSREYGISHTGVVSALKRQKVDLYDSPEKEANKKRGQSRRSRRPAPARPDPNPNELLKGD